MKQRRPEPKIEYKNPPESAAQAAQQSEASRAESRSEPPRSHTPGKPKLSEVEMMWAQFIGQRLTFQLKSGIVIQGDLVKEQKGFLRINNAVITGKSHRTEAAWVMVDRSNIGHFHPVSKVEKLESQG